MLPNASAIFAQAAADIVSAIASVTLTLPGGAVVAAVESTMAGLADAGGAPAGLIYADAEYVVPTASIVGLVKGDAVTVTTASGDKPMVVVERGTADRPAIGQTVIRLERP